MKRIEQPQVVSATYPRYVVATLPTGSYVVYDRWDARVADGRYLTLIDAQWAAEQRNQTTTTRTIRQSGEVSA